ncbi:MAG: amidohydrolase family protein [Actinobacteria bacterium]|nr:amidohydrolase family protein [Actinomycetota bacterium]
MAKKSLSKAKFWGPGGLSLTPTDLAIFREDIDWFLPKRIFDIHTHVNLAIKDGPPKVSLELLKQFQKMIFPKRTCNNLLLPVPLGNSQTSDQVNQYTSQQVRKFAERGDARLFFADPRMSATFVREQILQTRAVGLKVYMTRATAKNKTEAPIRSFLPERIIKVVDELGLMVMLHLSKRKAIVDPGNIRDLEVLSKRYSNSKWVLAHCARCFRPGMFEQVVDRLNTLPNVYVETSAVCDPLVFMEIFKNYDLSRLMFGSDNLLAAGFRGRYIECGLFWLPIGRPGFQWGQGIFAMQPTFVIYEQLRAMSRAARLVSLPAKDIRRVFWDNAVGLIKSIRQSKHKLPDQH